MIKKIFLSLFGVILLFSLCGCSASTTADEQSTPQSTPQQSSVVEVQENKGDTITINVYNAENEQLYSDTITTEKSNLFEIISGIPALEIVSEDSEGGKFIVSVMGISYGDSYYWHCYVNGVDLPDNISLLEVKDNDAIDFRYEKVGD